MQILAMEIETKGVQSEQYRNVLRSPVIFYP
jgi:hypothetical protein